MRAIGLVGLLIALAAGYAVYNAQLTRSPSAGAASPQQTIDLTAVRRSLLEIGQAQRLYVNAHGTYGTLEDLRKDGPPSLGTNARGYVFAVETSGAARFRATATPEAGSAPSSPTFVIDETMEIRALTR